MLRRGFCLGISLCLVALVAPGWLRAEEKVAATKTKAATKTDSAFGNFLVSLFSEGTKDESTQTTKAKADTSHEEKKAISVKGKYGGVQTISLNPVGENVVALVGPGRYDNANKKSAKSEVFVYSPTGEKVTSWEVNFIGSAINCAPTGEVYVAGSGKIAKFDAKGKLLGEVEIPHIAEVVKDKEKLKKKANERRDQMIATYKQQVEVFKKQAKASKDPDKGTKNTYTDESGKKVEYSTPSPNQMLKIYEDQLKQMEKRSVAEYESEILGQIRGVNSIAVSSKDIFVTTGEATGYGYSVWRTDLAFNNPKNILSGLRGCCGQMDVQCCDDCLVIAQNCDHAVGKYDRDGKKIAKFGKRARSAEPDCFGGCCNPMNTRPTSAGEVYTAESEGYIKRFDSKGEFAGNIAIAKLSGGCKNVALAVSKNGDNVYFCDLPGSRILILSRKKTEVAGVR